MFSNIGNKIRVLAKVICIIGIVLAALTGIIVMIIGFTMLGNRYTTGAGVGLIFAGIVIAAFGALYSWISSFVLYGYGQLIHSTQNIEKKIVGENTDYDAAHAAAPQPASYPAYPTPQAAPEQPAGNVCPNCGALNTGDSRFCITCGNPLNNI